MKRTLVASIAISAAALVAIATHEGYKDEAYIPVKGDVPTIGFGETKGVKLGDKTTPVRALVQLLESTEAHAQGVRQCLDGAFLYPNEFNAYVSLAYNVGVSRFCNSTIPTKIKAQQYAAACDTILEFSCGPATSINKAKPGQPCFSKKKPLRQMPGLLKRRKEEHAICTQSPQ